MNVKVPDNGGEEYWNFRGQIIQLVLEPTMTIGEVKENLSGYLGGMPASKMRLKTLNHSALKDNYSLARYNIIPNTLFDLLIKERGGRK